MKTQQLLVALTVANASLLMFLLTQPQRVAAHDIVPVLRGHALEIVDDQGRVRAAIRVLPADTTVRMADGTTGYPEAVLLQLISSKGRPNVKIAATEDGSALVLGGESDPTLVQILARGVGTSLKLTNKDGKQQLIKP